MKIFKDAGNTIKIVEKIIDTLYDTEEIITHRFVLNHPGSGREDIQELDNTPGTFGCKGRSELLLSIFQCVSREFFRDKYGDKRVSRKEKELRAFVKQTFNSHSMKLKRINRNTNQKESEQNSDKRKKKKTNRDETTKVSKKSKGKKGSQA